MHKLAKGLALLALTVALAGCQLPPTDMTFQRGSHLLAAGSPKSAIPFLSQTVASVPDGPEPLALLSLAFALDMQPDRAIAEAALVKRPAKQPPGWEAVAVGIAEMTRRRPEQAEESLQRVVSSAPADSPIGRAARQWLTLAQVLAGHRDQAVETLQSLAESTPMKASAMLWATLLHAQAGRQKQAAESLTQCAAAVTRNEPVPAGELSGQALYDSAVATAAAGDLDAAQVRFATLTEQDPAAADTPVWKALLAAVRGDWPSARALLKDACRTGALRSRGLANQLFAVVSALEDRPDAMIEHMLAGQRLLGRSATPAYVVEQPKPEPVWFSDHMK
jgi:tetratricopeptide (TPR) repeat protein